MMSECSNSINVRQGYASKFDEEAVGHMEWMLQFPTSSHMDLENSRVSFGPHGVAGKLGPKL